jgi:hypothetical protein
MPDDPANPRWSDKVKTDRSNEKNDERFEEKTSPLARFPCGRFGICVVHVNGAILTSCCKLPTIIFDVGCVG